jgi:hypothetical protein
MAFPPLVGTNQPIFDTVGTGHPLYIFCTTFAETELWIGRFH